MRDTRRWLRRQRDKPNWPALWGLHHARTPLKAAPTIPSATVIGLIISGDRDTGEATAALRTVSRFEFKLFIAGSCRRPWLATDQGSDAKNKHRQAERHGNERLYWSARPQARRLSLPQDQPAYLDLVPHWRDATPGGFDLIHTCCTWKCRQREPLSAVSVH